MRAVHRPQHHLLVFKIHGREHIVVIMFPVAGTLVELHFGEIRRVHVLISGGPLALQNVIFEQPANGRALGQPERQPRADEFVYREQFELLAQLAVVAALGFFQPVEILVEILLRKEGGAVDALQLLVLLVAFPVGAGDGEQLERLDLGGRRNVRARGRNR